MARLFSLEPNIYLDPNAETLISVIKTLIYGNKASAPQTEEGMLQLADHLKTSEPKLADFLTECRFVDDLNTSEASSEECDYLQEAAERNLQPLGVEFKGWGRSGTRPCEEISQDGTMGVAGLCWNPEIDSLEVKLGELHFGKVSRGRLTPGTEIYKGRFGNFDDMDKFVPEKLTKKLIVSKFMGIFDLLGKLIPLTARMKKDMRRMMKATPTWDEAVTEEHRSSWVKNFLDIEKAKGLKFTRPRMPLDAVDKKMRLMVLVDATQNYCWSGQE